MYFVVKSLCVLTEKEQNRYITNKKVVNFFFLHFRSFSYSMSFKKLHLIWFSSAIYSNTNYDTPLVYRKRFKSSISVIFRISALSCSRMWGDEVTPLLGQFKRKLKMFMKILEKNVKQVFILDLAWCKETKNQLSKSLNSIVNVLYTHYN